MEQSALSAQAEVKFLDRKTAWPERGEGAREMNNVDRDTGAPREFAKLFCG